MADAVIEAREGEEGLAKRKEAEAAALAEQNAENAEEAKEEPATEVKAEDKE